MESLMHSSNRPCAPLLAVPLALLLSASIEARSWGQLEFDACTLAPSYSPVSSEAQCTRVEVPEDPEQPDGRMIELAVAWIPASGTAQDDPVVLLAGGPGQSARDSYPVLASSFSDLRRSRHVLLIDQRGTGGSNPLVCRDPRGEEAVMAQDIDDSPEAAREFAESCLEQLQDKGDLRLYSTGEAVADLEYVRNLIGAPAYNLLGISYGTRVAQQYAARYPEHTRSLVLDGVVPNTLVLGNEHARNLEDALDRQFAACQALPACVETLGNPRENLDRLLENWADEGLAEVSYRDPRSGEMRSERPNRGHVAAVARMYAYSPMSAALLPLSLHEAAQGRPQTLLAQAQMLIGSLSEQMAYGMQLSVMCNEDADELRADDSMQQSVLGNAMIDLLQAQCAVWPRGKRHPGFRNPLSGGVPTLLLSGELDPVTPPRYGEEVLASLDTARHLVLEGQGHNVLPVGCSAKLVARFVDTLDPDELDASCLEGLNSIPPFTGFYGWEP